MKSQDIKRESTGVVSARCTRDAGESFRVAVAVAYLEARLKEANGNAALIAKAIGEVARVKGMSRVASDARLSRPTLYKSLSGENTPNFETVVRVLDAMGLQFRITEKCTHSGADRGAAARESS